MADSTLDEIIKQKRMKRFNTNKQGKQQPKKGGIQNKFKMQQQQNKNKAQNKGRLFQEVQKDLGIRTIKKPNVGGDARNKIIQSQRVKFTDARDRLAMIAKQGDARDKLNKIRKTRPGDKVVPQQKKTLVKKKIVKVPRQTFNVGHTQMKGAAVVRTVAGAAANRRNKVIGKSRMNRPTGRTLPIANNPSVITIKNNQAHNFNQGYQVVSNRQNMQFGQRAQPFGGGMGVPSPMETVVVRSEPVMRARPAETVVYERDYEEVRPSRLRITTPNNDYRVGGQQYVNEWETQNWQPQGRMQPRKREYYDNQEEYEIYPKKMAVAAQAQPVQSEPGTKVVVSNLHPCVSVEDMEELFGTIGSVLSVRMVRQGVAEAVFVSQSDAYRSVQLFNNRQLDGQPMKVFVVRKKQVMASNTVQARSVLKNARGRSGYYVQ